MYIGPVSLANQTLPDRSVVEGDSFNVTFTITDHGNPAVSLLPSWTFNGEALLENASVTIFEDGLQFINVASEDAGTYMKAALLYTAGSVTTFTFNITVDPSMESDSSLVVRGKQSHSSCVRI